MKRRNLKCGQVWTSHDGTDLYRDIVLISSKDGRVWYRGNRGERLHVCRRSTFVSWLSRRQARKTQKYRERSL